MTEIEPHDPIRILPGSLRAFRSHKTDARREPIGHDHARAFTFSTMAELQGIDQFISSSHRFSRSAHFESEID